MSADPMEDFNAATKRFQGGLAYTDLVLTEYTVLLRFRGLEAGEKEKLAEALFDCAYNALERHIEPAKGTGLKDAHVKSVDRLLAALGKTEDTAWLPQKAPLMLADLALGLARKAANFSRSDDYDMNWDDYCSYKAALQSCADVTLKHAEKFKTIIDRRNEDITTSKAISPARRIVLKGEGPAP